ncbi:unnamed protein product [Schistosoma intercalatum]|nr:unnamed protein product [Schistosoma intercalatum]
MEHVKSTGCYQPLTSDQTPVSSLAEDVAFADITKVSSEEFAKQITLIELSYFKAIHREEFASLKWNGREKHLCAPNIVASTRWFNQINFWVQKEILKYSCVSKRTEMLSFFIKISKKLVEFNNLYSAMSIISALQVECIYRLRHTWAGLGNKDRAAYRRLEELFSQNDNCRRQREHMNSIGLPGIPYLGLYLSDLTYTNVAQPRINGKPTAVWFTKINSIIDKIAYFQQSEYSFAVDGTLNAYLCAQRYIEELQKFLEEDNYKTSLILEPPPTLPTPSLSYLPQKIYGTTSSTISSSNNSNLDSSNILKNQNSSSTNACHSNNTGLTFDGRNSGFGFRSPSKLSSFVHNTKNSHHYQNHSRHGSNVSCKGATVNSSFEADLLPTLMTKHITHSNDHINNSIQVSNSNKLLECKTDQLKSMRKVSWEQTEGITKDETSQSQHLRKEFSTLPRPKTKNSFNVTDSDFLCTSEPQSSTQELEFLFPEHKSSQLPPIPPRPFIDCEQTKHSTLSRSELKSEQLNLSQSLVTTDQCTSPKLSSTNYCKSFSVSGSLPVNDVSQSNIPATSSVTNLLSEFSLCSMNDVFNSSAVAVAACATSLSAVDASCTTPPAPLSSSQKIKNKGRQERLNMQNRKQCKEKNDDNDNDDDTMGTNHKSLIKQHLSISQLEARKAELEIWRNQREEIKKQEELLKKEIENQSKQAELELKRKRQAKIQHKISLYKQKKMAKKLTTLHQLKIQTEMEQLSRQQKIIEAASRIEQRTINQLNQLSARKKAKEQSEIPRQELLERIPIQTNIQVTRDPQRLCQLTKGWQIRLTQPKTQTIIHQGLNLSVNTGRMIPQWRRNL